MRFDYRSVLGVIIAIILAAVIIVVIVAGIKSGVDHISFWEAIKSLFGVQTVIVDPTPEASLNLLNFRS